MIIFSYNHLQSHFDIRSKKQNLQNNRHNLDRNDLNCTTSNEINFKSSKSFKSSKKSTNLNCSRDQDFDFSPKKASPLNRTMPVPGSGQQNQNHTQGLVHWMSAVMAAEHMTTSNTHHDPSVGMHYMWNGAVEVSRIYDYDNLIIVTVMKIY